MTRPPTNRSPRAHRARREYEVKPIGWVESALTDPAQAPNQGDEGAPFAWLVIEPHLAEGIRNLSAGEHIIVVSWLDRARRDELSTIPETTQAARRWACSAPAHPTGPTRSASTEFKSWPSTACDCGSAASKRLTAPRSSNQAGPRPDRRAIAFGRNTDGHLDARPVDRRLQRHPPPG
jgi:hypothetical protein